jgi:hypothetical protein
MPTPILLAGGNPQIPMGFGEAPVAAFHAAVPATGSGGWKHAACRRIDAIVSREVPGVCKAVKWNSPFYGAEQGCWFLSFHCYDTYVKVRWHNGKLLTPMPPIDSPQGQTRYLKVYVEGDLGDQFADWVRQAAVLPGERL